MERCHCGQPLHYTDPATEAYVRSMVQALGEYIEIILQSSHRPTRIFLVQRHYLALHGIKAWELPTLGFKEVTSHGLH